LLVRGILKVFEKPSERAAIEGLAATPFGPRAILKFAQILHQIAGGEAIRIVAVKESVTDVVKSDNGLVDFVVAGIVENPLQSKARLLRPSATNQVCQEEQRFHVITLAKAVHILFNNTTTAEMQEFFWEEFTPKFSGAASTETAQPSPQPSQKPLRCSVAGPTTKNPYHKGHRGFTKVTEESS